MLGKSHKRMRKKALSLSRNPTKTSEDISYKSGEIYFLIETNSLDLIFVQNMI